MSSEIVFTLTGPDRIGIVEEVARVLLDLGGNAGTSRMVRLGGQFAVLMMITLPQGDASVVDQAFSELAAQGYKITVTPAGTSPLETAQGWLPYRIEVSGADHEGIIHEIARGLARVGINIESAETGTLPSPVSGTPLFTMTALVAVPAELDATDWIATLEQAADQSNVDVHVTIADAL